VRQASRIFRSSFGLLIGIMPIARSNAKCRQKPFRDRDCRRFDAIRRYPFVKRRQRFCVFRVEFPQSILAAPLSRRHYAGPAVHRNKDKPRARKNFPPPRWCENRNCGIAIGCGDAIAHGFFGNFEPDREIERGVMPGCRIAAGFRPAARARKSVENKTVRAVQAAASLRSVSR
jgi:hypothetical protein